MIKRLKKLFKIDFLRDVTKLMTGTIIAQVITISVMPLLAKLYTPEQFGIYALYFSLVSTLGFVSTGRYDTAIVLPKDNNTAGKILILSLYVCFWFSVLLTVLLLIFPSAIWEKMGAHGFSKIAVYLPIGVFISGIFQCIYSWHNRNKNYSLLSKNKVLQNLTVSGVNVSGGFGRIGVGGLVFGYISGQVISTASLLYKESRTILYFFKKFNRESLKQVVVTYKNFPLFLAPMVFLNTISLNILVFLLTAYFSESMVGLYSQAYKAINYPLLFISASVTPVFFQKLNETKGKVKFFLISLVSCIIIAVIILFPIVIWGKELFTFVFGKQWEFSGSIAAVLCPLTIASFAVGNLTTLFSVTQTNHILLIWQIVYLVMSCVIIITLKDLGILTMLGWFSAFGTTMYLILALIGYKIIKRKENEDIQ